MPWNFNKIREACKENNLTCPEIYLMSLSWQHWKAWYHAQQAQKVWDEFKSAHPGSHEIGGGNKQWWDAYYTSAAETEATVQTLHAEADIIAQTVNQIILRQPIPEKDVAISTISDMLRSQNLAPNVVTKIEKFRSSKEFKYINAFCNTAKHRNLIHKQWHVEGGEGTRNEEGVRFLAFSYKGHNFPITWASDINGPYRETLGRLVKEIGNAIIDHLRLNL